MKLNAIDYDKNQNLNKTDQDSCESHLIDIVSLAQPYLFHISVNIMA